MPTGPVLLNLLLGYTGKDRISVVQFNGTNVGELDQALRLRANGPGVYDLQVRWDRIPHTFSTNARSLGSETSPGVFVLPTPRPDTATWNGTAPYLTPVRTLWNAAQGRRALHAVDEVGSQSRVHEHRQNRVRPMGMASGRRETTCARSRARSTKQCTTCASSSAYSTHRLQVVGTYDLSAVHQ